MTEKISVKDIDVYIEGEGQDTIVMIHGWPDTYRVWDGQVEALKDKYRCVRFTLPGYALDKPRRYYDLEQMIEIIDAIVTEVGQGKPVTLMIHDWGCLFGYQFYLRNQDKVSKIIAIDIGDAGSSDHILSAKVKAFMFGYQMWLATAWKIGGSIGDKMTRMMAKALHAPGDPATITSAMTYSYYWKWSHTLTGRSLGVLPLEVKCPLLFTYGKNKPGMFHSKAWEKRMAAIEGNGVMPFDTRHWVMTEQPERFNSLVLDWLAIHQPQEAETEVKQPEEETSDVN